MSDGTDNRILGKWASDVGKTGRSVHDLSDGSIKAEALQGGRLVEDDTGTRVLSKGVWLELAKNSEGKGVLRLRSPSREDLLMSVPLGVIHRVACPRVFHDSHIRGCHVFAPISSWLCGLVSQKARILEVEGTVDGGSMHAAFLVKDPEAWQHAVESPDWEH